MTTGHAHPDVTIAELAARQHGVVSRRQLIAAGIGGEAIRHRVTVRRLRRVHTGVYAVGRSLSGLQGRGMAAVLACGDGAVLSHRTAAALWGLQPAPSGPIDVTICSRSSRNRPGIAVHVARSLHVAEVGEHDGVPCTTIARTLLDLAGVVSTRVLDRALEQALILGVFDRGALDQALARSRGRRGAGVLRRLLVDLADEPPPLRSELERRFLELVRRSELSDPVVNGRIAEHEVDFHWPPQRLIAETDGRATHGTSRAFERDRQRDLDLELAGWHVVRISWRQLVDQPQRVIALLRSHLRR